MYLVSMNALSNYAMLFLCICFSSIIIFLDFLEGFSLFENPKYLAFGAVTTLIFGLIYFLTKAKKIVVYPIIYVLIFVVLPFTNFSPTKPLNRSYYKFRNGMSINEITDVVKNEFAKTKFNHPEVRQIDPNTQQFILDPNDSDYDSFWLIVHYKNKLYQRARISPD